MYIIESYKRLIDNLLKSRLNYEITSGDLTGWLLGFLGGFFVFLFIQRMQNTMQRHQVIKEVEGSINSLFSDNIAFIRKVKYKKNELKKRKIKCVEKNVSIRTILHDKTPWQIYHDGNEISHTIKGKKYIKIRDDNIQQEFISTQALHEILIAFRRIEKLYKDGILKEIDLADLWRELIPFGVNGRLEFFEGYFGESDVQVIAYVVFSTLIACEKYHVKKAVSNFRGYYIKNEKIHNCFYKNTRFRLRERIIKRFKFRNIIYR